MQAAFKSVSVLFAVISSVPIYDSTFEKLALLLLRPLKICC